MKDKKININIVEAAPRLMPKMPRLMSRAFTRRLRHLGVKVLVQSPVQGETSDALLMNGERLMSKTVIWTAGIANNPFFKENHFTLAQNGKVLVDKLLQAWPGVYVIGDNADTPFSGMAQTALYDAKFVTENLTRHVEGKMPYIYKPRKPVYVTPVGKGWAGVLWGKFEIYGSLGWIIRKAADWIGYRDVEPWWKATQRMIDTGDEEDDCTLCAVNEGK
jgi:NADH:ubiquinone reductase (H+-translocating)